MRATQLDQPHFADSGHVYQLGGYAPILDETEQRPVNKGFVYLIPQKDALVLT